MDKSNKIYRLFHNYLKKKFIFSAPYKCQPNQLQMKFEQVYSSIDHFSIKSKTVKLLRDPTATG